MPLWALAVLACYYFFSSTAYADGQTVTNPNNCPNTYTGTVQAYGDGTSTNTYDTTQYSSTVICNTINIQDIIDSTIFTNDIPTDASGNPIGVYNPLTDEFTFSNNTTSSVTATASFAINAALQAAGIGIEFRGFKYEWEVYKPSANSDLKLTVRIRRNDGGEGLSGNGLVYQSTHSYAGQSFTDWTAKDSGNRGTPPFAFQIQDGWTAEASVSGDTQGDGVRKLKYTFTYAPKTGHENDFDPNYVYPGQESAQQSDFDSQCSIDPQYSPGCPGYQDPSIDDGIDDNSQPVTGLEEDSTNDILQEELAATGIDSLISDTALQTGTNADGSLSSAIIDTGAEPQDGSIIIIEDPNLTGMPEDTMSTGVIELVDSQTGEMLLDDTLVDLNNLIEETLMEIETSGVDITPGILVDVVDNALTELGGELLIIDLPEAELQAIDEQLVEIMEVEAVDPSTGNAVLVDATTGEGTEIEMVMPEDLPDNIAIEGDVSSEVSNTGEVALEVDGTLSSIPDEPEVLMEPEEIIEIEAIESTEAPLAEATVVSETGTISETAIVEKPTLNVTQRKALSVASATTIAAIEVAGQQAYASTTSGIEQSQSGSNADAQGNSINSGGTGSTVGATSNSGADFSGTNTNSSSTGSTNSTGTTSTASDNAGNFNFDTGADTGPQTALGQTSSSGDIDIAAIIEDSSINALNQSGPSGVFESEESVTGQVETGAQLALGGSVTYEETNETMFGTIVIPQLDFTIREMIDAVIRKTLVDAGLESEFLTLDEVSQEDLKAQQDLEDKLVEEAIAGSTSEDANAAYLGYNPTFRDYVVPQVYGGGVQSFYASKTIYPNNTNYDHPNQRFFNGASDVKHRALVRMQYEN